MSVFSVEKVIKDKNYYYVSLKLEQKNFLYLKDIILPFRNECRFNIFSYNLSLTRSQINKTNNKKNNS